MGHLCHITISPIARLDRQLAEQRGEIRNLREHVERRNERGEP
jgi:hypothetical protein